MAHVTDFLAQYWPHILLFVSGTTVLNRIMQKLAERHPGLARVASIVTSLSIDLWIVVREIGSFFKLTVTDASETVAASKEAKQATVPPKKPPSVPPSGLAAIVLLVFTSSVACSSFMHFSDPTLDDMVSRLCGQKLDHARTQIEREAEKAGVPVAELLTAFLTACQLRAKRGLDDGESAGMEAVGAKVGAARR